MSSESIIAQIDAEIARLEQVRTLLASTSKVPTTLTGRKSAKLPVKAKATAKKTRVLSPEALKRISDAQRKRWAAKKANA